jgi:glycosyltransferase involved in cell wall biosynthesis
MVNEKIVMNSTLISVVTPCYNEKGNVEELYQRVKSVFNILDGYTYEHIFIDNASSDGTVTILKDIAARDKNVKIIINTRNFGHIRSPYHAMMQAKGNAVILIVSDLQDPPEMIPDFISKWKEGNKLVIGVKTHSDEFFVIFGIRKFYYYLINKLSDTELVKNFTGFGLYDREVINTLDKLNDSYPYLRGLVSELGYEPAKIEYKQPLRKRGLTKNNFYTLYDMAMLGFTNHSKVPLRLATFTGFIVSMFSLMIGAIYLIYKLIFFDNFDVGMAPLVVGLFFFSAVQLIFIGVIGEYIGSIHTQVLKRPLVIEKERVNFEN